MALYTIRTTRGREKLIIENIYFKLKDKNSEVYALFHPKKLRGYVFIEAKDRDSVLSVISYMPNIRGILKEESSVESIKHYLTEKEEKIVFKQGDIVEIIRGPFKKEKAKIKTINEAKGESKIELINSIVPIPITIKLNQLKQLETNKD